MVSVYHGFPLVPTHKPDLSALNGCQGSFGLERWAVLVCFRSGLSLSQFSSFLGTTSDDINSYRAATEQIHQDIKGVGIKVEAVQSDVQHISEAVDSHSRQLERLEPMQKTLAQVKSEVDVVKTTLEQVNLVDLKQEVSDLKKRVEDLETRVVK